MSFETETDVASAANKIQASFRGHKAKKAAEKEKVDAELSEELKKLKTNKEEVVSRDTFSF